MKRTILALAAAALAAVAFQPTNAGAVEYVKVCSTFGTGWFYIPGTDTCYDTATGELRQNGPKVYNPGVTVMDRVDTLEERTGFALSGAAIGIALPNPIVNPGATFSIAGNWGQVAGHNAFGLSAAIAVGQHVLITGGVGVALDGVVGTRAGWNLSFGGR